MDETVNFQIQYFPKEKKDEFKEWASKLGFASMKELQLELIHRRKDISKILEK